MSEDKKKFIKLKANIKAIGLIAYAILAFNLVDDNKLPYLMAFSSAIISLIRNYVLINELKFAKGLVNLVLSFYNVISLFFMIQYFLGQETDLKIYEYSLGPFLGSDLIRLPYIIWIFVLTLFLLTTQTKTMSIGREYNDR